jgi:hypothetical protein
MKKLLGLILLALLPALHAAAPAKRPFDLNYTIELLPKSDQARVTIALGKGGDLVSEVRFKIDGKRFGGFDATGKFRNEAGIARWEPNGVNARLSYLVRIDHVRQNGSFDARMTPDWAIFRGDKVIPSIRARMKKGATSNARLFFKLPPGWTHLDTGWPRVPAGPFIVDSPDRRFDRPIGWMIAGRIGTRRDQIGLTEIAIGAPRGDPLNRMDTLTMINFVWPEIEAAFGKMPRKILIVGAGDPMWRGGLSAPNSLFLHSERPLISENATSTLVHELVHVVTRIRGKDRSDWIAEGLAEFYSIELIHRAGGMTDERHEKVFAWLAEWSGKVETLRGDHSSAEITARAVLLLRDLDAEIRRRSKDRASLDDVVRALRPQRVVSTADFIAASEKVIGGKSSVLASTLLH